MAPPSATFLIHLRKRFDQTYQDAMVMLDPRIDAYIENAEAFAQPILRHLRNLLRLYCADLEETMKWSSPFFDYHGHPLCSMAAFKQHCAFGFWKSEQLVADNERKTQARGDFGRLTSIDQLPDDASLAALIRQAMALTDSGQGALLRDQSASPKAAQEIPADLAAALSANPVAQTRFGTFSNSQRREYIEWVITAKRPDTREKRVRLTVEQCAEGRSMNWKYATKK